MDLILSVDEARRAKRLSQLEIADLLGISQGHYSKVFTRRVPLSDGLANRMQVWLAANAQRSIGDEASLRIAKLAMSIRRECMELMHLVGLAEGGGGGGGRGAA